MKAVTTDDAKQEPYSLFELIEFTIFDYLSGMDSGSIPVGANSDPRIFRTYVLAALAGAKLKLSTDIGQAALESLRKDFPGTKTALDRQGLGHLGTV